jgi:hypothetical protein
VGAVAEPVGAGVQQCHDVARNAAVCQPENQRKSGSVDLTLSLSLSLSLYYTMWRVSLARGGGRSVCSLRQCGHTRSRR